MKSLGERQCTLRSSVRFKREGVNIETIGWPFARLRVNSETVHITAFALLHGERLDWTLPRASITRIERSQNGIRIFAAGYEDPWVCGSIFSQRFLRELAVCGLVPEGPVIPSAWNRI